MKTVALFLCFVVAGVLAAELSDADKQKLKEVHGKCQKDPATHVDSSVFDSLKKGEKIDLPANFGAHMLCMSKGTGLQNEDGTLNKQLIKEKVEESAQDKSNVDKVVEECAVEKETPEKTAEHLFKCFHEKHVQYRHIHGDGHEHAH